MTGQSNSKRSELANQKIQTSSIVCIRHLCAGLREHLQLSLELLGGLERLRLVIVTVIAVKEFVVVVIIRCQGFIMTVFYGRDGLCKSLGELFAEPTRKCALQTQ